MPSTLLLAPPPPDLGPKGTQTHEDFGGEEHKWVHQNRGGFWVHQTRPDLRTYLQLCMFLCWQMRHTPQTQARKFKFCYLRKKKKFACHDFSQFVDYKN